MIRRYRTGQIPNLPPDEESLLAMRERLELGETSADTALATPARAIMEGAEKNAGTGMCSPPEPRVMTVDEAIAQRWREAREEQRKNPAKRRVLFGVPVR